MNEMWNELIFFGIFSYLSAPTKLLTEMVADQVAPSYWVPNKYVIVRYLRIICCE